MADSRDANDPRDLLRALRKEARAEFDRSEGSDTGGQEHASRADREGIPPEHRPVEAAAEDRDRASREQTDAGTLRMPRGDAATSGGGNRTRGPTPPGPGEPRDDDER
ncbi:MAG TPA: hypothetical protein VF894_16510 [Anaeromyxobacter sp.]